MMRTMRTTLAALFAAALWVIARPFAARAATSGSKTWDFTTPKAGGDIRVPSSSGNDYSAGQTTGHGWFFTDVTTCIEGQTNRYETWLYRDRSFAPDQQIDVFKNVGFCAVQQQHFGLDWSSGKFHVNVDRYGSNMGPSTGRGWDSISWS
jgi:hypothetical protein